MPQVKTGMNVDAGNRSCKSITLEPLILGCPLHFGSMLISSLLKLEDESTGMEDWISRKGVALLFEATR